MASSRSCRSIAGALALTAVAMLFTPTSVQAGVTGTTTRVSVSSTGAQASGRYPDISADGRYVSFISGASDVVPGDTNNIQDAFVHDLTTGAVSRVSVASDGTEANAYVAAPSISGDGRHVTFTSDATNLVPNDTNGFRDLFVRDRHTGVTTRVDVATDGTQSNAREDPGLASMSADGRYVTFSSTATNLVVGDTNLVRDVFVRDRTTGVTTAVTDTSIVPGQRGPMGGTDPAISADGRYVAFASASSGVGLGDPNALNHVFVHDRQTGVTTRESVATDGTPASATSRMPTISGDGRYVAFESAAVNLVVGDTNGQDDVFVRDRQTGTTSRVSVAGNGAQADSLSERPDISADGRYVVFLSIATNLVDGDTNAWRDVFLHDRQTGSTIRSSVAKDGSQGNDESGGYPSDPAVSDDGRYVSFQSGASNLVAGDTNRDEDVFVRDGQGVSAPPVLSVGDVSVAEKDSGDRPAVFTVSLSEPSAATVNVAYATANGTAMAPGDYAADSGTLSFAPGTTSRTISVVVNGDGNFEGNETFTLVLSTPEGATLGDATAVGTIVDDDPAVSVGDAQVYEGHSGTRAATFAVTLSEASPSTVTVVYATSNAGALAGTDYTAKTGSLSFAPGVTTMAVKVPVLGDTVDEASSEGFTLTLSAPDGATLGDPSGAGSILDDDPTTAAGRRLAIGNVSIHEGDAGSRTALVNVSLSEPSSSTISVNFATVKGTATKTGDFVGTTGTLIFPPGATSLNVKVTVNSDTIAEPAETFAVQLSGLTGSGTIIADDTGLVTIVDDD